MTGKIKKALPQLFAGHPPDLLALAAMLIMIVVMVRVPLANAGRPEDPAPPTAIV
jgi:hypothetical protein